MIQNAIHNYCNNIAIFDGSEDGGAYDPIFPTGLPGECHPFEEVKSAAGEFIARVLDKDADEEEDRLAIVTFGNGWSTKEDPPGSGIIVPDLDMATGIRTSGWTNDQGTALGIVENLEDCGTRPLFLGRWIRKDPLRSVCLV